MAQLQPGDPELIGRFRLLGRLDSGGMGRVYLARSPDGTRVAVKVIHSHLAEDEDFRAQPTLGRALIFLEALSDRGSGVRSRGETPTRAPEDY